MRGLREDIIFFYDVGKEKMEAPSSWGLQLLSLTLPRKYIYMGKVTAVPSIEVVKRTLMVLESPWSGNFVEKTINVGFVHT